MNTKPGQRQIERGREFKSDTGSSPNGVGNAWLAKRRGKLIQVYVLVQGSTLSLMAEGRLVAFDAYSFEIDDTRGATVRNRLIFKGPGMVFDDAD